MDRCNATSCRASSSDGWLYWWLFAMALIWFYDGNQDGEYLPKVECVAVQAEVANG